MLSKRLQHSFRGYAIKQWLRLALGISFAIGFICYHMFVSFNDVNMKSFKNRMLCPEGCLTESCATSICDMNTGKCIETLRHECACLDKTNNLIDSYTVCADKIHSPDRTSAEYLQTVKSMNLFVAVLLNMLMIGGILLIVYCCLFGSNPTQEGKEVNYHHHYNSSDYFYARVAEEKIDEKTKKLLKLEEVEAKYDLV